ncbi:hypothetical protein C467_01126 [Halorubrum hochstenium ATCC 700873]|uniref:Uncharacterized protein n=2 Tax=Haloferacaceae TaxID=1644056 RepID=M0FQR2_9EURY|nr:hypothetical protein C467_01126 [Halorubrum hochstenium ATCC 700873]
MADTAATAETYRDRGWTALELHPGDSVLVDSAARTGLDVVLPGPEYEELEATVAACEFTAVEAYRAEADGLMYLLIVERDPENETAVLVPAYYDPGGSEPKLDAIREAGEFALFCRRLNDEYVRFVHTDIAPFLPAGLADG